MFVIFTPYTMYKCEKPVYIALLLLMSFILKTVSRAGANSFYVTDGDVCIVCLI